MDTEAAAPVESQAATTGTMLNLLPRTWIPRADTAAVPQPPGARTFVAAQWNTLNSTLCDAKAFPFSPVQALPWEFRRTLILAELDRLASVADVIAMEVPTSLRACTCDGRRQKGLGELVIE